MPVMRGNKAFYDYEASDILAHNLKYWLQYGLIETGAYTAVRFGIATSGYTNLKRVYDAEYGGEGRVYEMFGPGLVWESGVSVIDTGAAPLFQVSGVYVNNNYFPTATTTGAYGHIIDYERGRVVFNNAVSANSGIKAEYLFRDIAVYLSDSPQWKVIIDNYFTKFDRLDDFSPSGMASTLKENRVWLPCIVIDVDERTNRGLQLGGGEYADFGVFYHIFSDMAFSNRRIIDLLNNQIGKRYSLYNINTAPNPLNYDGTISSGAKTYTQLAYHGADHFWTFADVEESTARPVTVNSDLYRGECRQLITVARYLSTY